VCKDDNTALHVSCLNGHVDIVRTLLESGANPDGVPYCSLNNQESFSQEDIQTAGTDSGSRCATSTGSDNTAKCTRPIHLAAKHGVSKIIKLLANAGANVNALNLQKQSALHIATAQSNFLVSTTNRLQSSLPNWYKTHPKSCTSLGTSLHVKIEEVFNLYFF
jgi:ankyrin repeat protein